MSINDTEHIIKQLEREESALKNDIEKLEGKLNDIRSQIKKLRGSDVIPWSERAIEYISIAKELLSTEEILKSVFKWRIEELDDPHKRKGYITGLSVALHNLCKSGKLISHSVKGIKGLYYGLPAWHEKDAKLKSYYQDEFDIKTNKVINSKSGFYRIQENKECA